MKKQNLLWIAAFSALILSPVAHAGQADKKVIVKEEVPEKGAPLPLHEIEGNGGVLTTLSAYIVNPPRNGEPVGRPAIGTGLVSLGNGRVLVPVTATWSPWERIELGYGFDWYSIGSLSGAIHDKAGVSLGTTSVGLHNFNPNSEVGDKIPG